ncbi:dpy-30 protein [Niveomyces insectorum RCEF 264]|uniref:Dpy-30 protein n=1 Tax=Niveomyces insectorum RCEF 264 TaxID=1081102 RepID=A0A162J6C1_9HYPO|nr:dpy-30 protein [Niveomyces insectorum RCEF 264]
MSEHEIESQLFKLQDVLTTGTDGVRPAATAPQAAFDIPPANATAAGRDSAGDVTANTVSSPALQEHSQSNARTSTPMRQTANGERLDSASRAASAHPESTFTIPNEVPPNGAPVRQYINNKLTGPLLEDHGILYES